MMQGSYIAESAQDLIKRSQQTLAKLSTLNNQLISTVDPCYGITIKNVVNSISSSIVTCTNPTPGTCSSPGTCPSSPDPTTYINMVVSFNAVSAQSTGATITFQYVLNGAPTTTILIPGSGSIPAIVAGSNTYYAFPTNVQYPPDTNLVLYGVDIQV